ncbi:MAG: site-2 protease family protein [Candidatus Solibacter usitatus]|nr:site-2 protease family protein [Candidatus Solibacter usitatus]
MNLHLETAILNVCLLCILTVPHEFAHAWMADKLGDDTPLREDRLTLYPPSHIDLMGTVILPFITSLLGMGFLGWGRPVNTNPSQLKFGMNGLAMVAMAGPASNILLAVIFAGVSVIAGKVMTDLAQFCASAANLSVYLALFNLLPVPPLDGSKLLLAARVPVAIYVELARFGFILLLVALSATSLGTWLAVGSFTITKTIFGIFY